MGRHLRSPGFRHHHGQSEPPISAGQSLTIWVFRLWEAPFFVFPRCRRNGERRSYWLSNPKSPKTWASELRNTPCSSFHSSPSSEKDSKPSSSSEASA